MNTIHDIINNKRALIFDEFNNDLIVEISNNYGPINKVVIDFNYISGIPVNKHLHNHYKRRFKTLLEF